MVGVDDFVKHIDKGYDTFVGEGGNLLSVGTKTIDIICQSSFS